MNVEILEGIDGGACLYCSESDWAFGPVMKDYEEVELFLKFVPDDPRRYSNSALGLKYKEFRRIMDSDQKTRHENDLCLHDDCEFCKTE